MTFVPQPPPRIRIGGINELPYARVAILFIILMAVLPMGIAFISFALGPDVSGMVCIFPIFFLVIFALIVVTAVKTAAQRQRTMEGSEEAHQEGAYPRTGRVEGPWGEDWRGSYQEDWRRSPQKSEEPESGTSVLGKCPKCGNLVYLGDRQCMRCGWTVKERRLRPI